MKLLVKTCVLKLLKYLPSKRISFTAKASLALLALAPGQLAYGGGSDSGIINPIAMTMTQEAAIKTLVEKEIAKLSFEEELVFDDARAKKIEQLKEISNMLNARVVK